MGNRWYVNKEGQVRGPFPTGALVQDRLVGRLGDADLVGVDQVDWKPFASWPELTEALASAAQPAGGEEWNAERDLARMRWAEQRSGQDRRAVAASRTGEPGAPEEQRQRPGTERRGNPVSTARRSKTGASRASGILSAEIPLWVLLAGLAGFALLVAVLVYVFGAVNPVRVRIR